MFNLIHLTSSNVQYYASVYMAIFILLFYMHVVCAVRQLPLLTDGPVPTAAVHKVPPDSPWAVLERASGAGH